MRFELPATLTPGQYELKASARFSSGEVQTDSFIFHVLAPAPAPQTSARIALFDPKGETRQWLEQAGVNFQPVEASADLSAYDLLIVGKAALIAR